MTKRRTSASKSRSSAKPGAKAKPRARKAKPIEVRKGGKVILLSGGNPQIAKAAGDAEDDEFDEAQMATWVKQAAALPGGTGLGR